MVFSGMVVFLDPVTGDGTTVVRAGFGVTAVKFGGAGAIVGLLMMFWHPLHLASELSQGHLDEYRRSRQGIYDIPRYCPLFP